nr:MAG TPA: hypothetical protein [Caudoviricetes sp.]
MFGTVNGFIGSKTGDHRCNGIRKGRIGRHCFIRKRSIRNGFHILVHLCHLTGLLCLLISEESADGKSDDDSTGYENFHQSKAFALGRLEPCFVKEAGKFGFHKSTSFQKK